MQEKFSWLVKGRMPQKYRFLLLFVAFIVIVLDQVSKNYVRSHINLFEVIPFIKFWNWTLVYNEGAAFSLLADQGGWQKLFFGIVALLVSVGLVFYLLNRIYSGLTGLALSLILGGALGNLIDRIVHGRVTDFIQWYYQSHYWPSFNLADSFITVGITLLIIESLFFNKNKNS